MDNGDSEARPHAGFALAGTYYREMSHAFSEAQREGGDESAILLRRSVRGGSLRKLSHNRNKREEPCQYLGWQRWVHKATQTSWGL